MDYEMLDYFARIARALGETLIYKVLSSPDEYTDDDDILEVLENLVLNIEKQNKSRIITFKDRGGQVLRKNYIINFHPFVTFDGEPAIMINDFPEGLVAEKNPVLKLELIYDDFDNRNEDIEQLKYFLK